MKNEQQSAINLKSVAGVFLLLTVGSLLFYYRILFDSVVYDYRDMPRVLLPLEVMIRSILTRDATPYWNDMGGLGRPLFADPLSALAYIPQALFRLLPLPFAWNFSIAFHHVIAGLGAWLFLQQRRYSSTAALTGAFCFSFGGYLVSTDNMLNALQSASWFPWVFYVYEWAINEEGEEDTLSHYWLGSLGLALFVTLSFLGGMPEVVLYEAPLLFCLCLFPELFGNRSVNRSPLWRRISVLGMGAIVTTGLSSVLLLPLLEYLEHSTRASGLSPDAIVELSFSLVRLGELLVPSFLYNLQTDPQWLLSVCFGPILLLAIPSLWSTKWIHIAVWVVTAGVFVVLASGSNIPGYKELVEQSSLLRITRHPEKYLLVTHAFISLAIATGLSRLEGHMRRSIQFVVPAVALALLFIANGSLHPLTSWERLVQTPRIASAMEGYHPRIYADGIAPPNHPEILEDPETQKSLLLYHYGLFHGINNVNASSSLNLRDNEELIHFIEEAGPEKLVDRLRLFSIEYLTSTQALSKVENLSLLGHSGNVNVFSVPNPRALVYIPEQIYLTNDPNQMSSLLPSIADSTSDSVAYDDSATGRWFAQSGEVTQLGRFSPDRFFFTAKFENDGYVIINNNHYIGWKARCMKGACRESVGNNMLKANKFVTALKLPKGESTILMSFEPPSVMIGRGLTIWFFLLCFVVTLFVRMRQKRAN
ncbi:MAG: hypothetical protein KDD70_03715 [Bdellovibrionales bacterium]|nr:hypothetical protein [Bdellovibrionales bacterium]